ncbi:MAG TPA: hypothetical protein VNX46_08320 [Candidatus Acidoferrum sp.]|jgi:hypothetical protein|nr:hypothetical protein [Candidatus Acidoferrum sp.]
MSVFPVLLAISMPDGNVKALGIPDWLGYTIVIPLFLLGLIYAFRRKNRK